jgi:hypothetical protein
MIAMTTMARMTLNSAHGLAQILSFSNAFYPL